MVDDKICGGRGRCNCGRCDCETGFGGEDCSCSLDKRTCMEGNVSNSKFFSRPTEKFYKKKKTVFYNCRWRKKQIYNG